MLRRALTGSLVALTTLAAPRAWAEAQPHRSANMLVSSNGLAVAGYDVTQNRITSFLEHPYRTRSDGAQTRDVAYDLYPGLRVGSTGTWLGDVTPSSVAYEVGTGIIHVQRTVSGLSVDEYQFVPIGLAERALVSVLRVERTSGSAEPVDAYALFNFHLGAGAPDPGSEQETIAWDGTRDAWMEWGPSGLTLAYGSIGPSTHHGASPDNPFTALNSAADLSDNAGTGGTFDDAAAGLQWSLGNLATGQSAWAGSFVVLDDKSDVAPRIDAVRSWINGRTPEQLLTAEKAEWDAWHTPAPTGLSAPESDLFRQSMTILRMGQVTEAGKGNGQILASLPPGMWNISWVRDMAYAVVALSRSGHTAEAKKAIEFQLGADSGKYQDYVGQPYQISITRYFGDGVEESDSNENGPNIEFDGFGLFLWTVHEYVEKSNDEAALSSWWPAISSKVADVLVALQEPSGLIAPDSSIWEVHWNGQQKRFAYTTITAANGLCRAAALADRMGDAAAAEKYRSAGKKARDAIISELSAPDGTIAQSHEELQSGSGFLDAAAIEAVGMGLVDPKGRAASATFNALKTKLVPPSGRGFMRNDDGGWYDSQEWVFVDLRTANAMRMAGDADAPGLLGWITDQGGENFDLISELHDASTADYKGEMPMVGFGAGAYGIALMARENPESFLPCGDYASEELPDGGVVPDGGTGGAGGAKATPKEDDGGCGCSAVGRNPGPLNVFLGLFGLFALWRRRGGPTKSKG